MVTAETIAPMDGGTDEEKRDIVKLASEQVHIEAEVARIEEHLEKTKARLARVRDDLLPQAMADVGLLDFTLTTGWKIEEIGRAHV